MRLDIPPEDLNGSPPDLEGEVCEALLCQEFWYRDELDDPCNVVYIKTLDVWHRLYFDYGIVFWRGADGPPESFRAPEIEGAYRVVDYGTEAGIVGARIESMSIVREESGSAVQLHFEQGPIIRFFGGDDDSSRVFISPR